MPRATTSTVLSQVSLVPRPSRPPANIMRDYFYSVRKAGRSGRFCDVMIMSGGRGLAQHGRGWKNVWNVGNFKLNRHR